MREEKRDLSQDSENQATESSTEKFQKITNYSDIFRNQVMGRLSEEEIVAAAHSCKFFRNAIPLATRLYAMAQIRKKVPEMHEFSHRLMKENLSQEDPIHLKALVVGDHEVRKTALIQSFVNAEFSTAQLSTIGIDFCHKPIFLGNACIQMQLWDLAGQERNALVLKSYFRDAKIIYFVCDMQKRGLVSVKEWLEKLAACEQQENPVCVLMVKNAPQGVDRDNITDFVVVNKIRSWFDVDEKNKASINTAFEFGLRCHLQRVYPILPVVESPEAAVDPNPCRLM